MEPLGWRREVCSLSFSIIAPFVITASTRPTAGSGHGCIAECRQRSAHPGALATRSRSRSVTAVCRNTRICSFRSNMRTAPRASPSTGSANIPVTSPAGAGPALPVHAPGPARPIARGASIKRGSAEFRLRGPRGRAPHSGRSSPAGIGPLRPGPAAARKITMPGAR